MKVSAVLFVECNSQNQSNCSNKSSLSKQIKDRTSIQTYHKPNTHYLFLLSSLLRPQRAIVRFRQFGFSRKLHARMNPTEQSEEFFLRCSTNVCAPSVLWMKVMLMPGRAECEIKRTMMLFMIKSDAMRYVSKFRKQMDGNG